MSTTQTAPAPFVFDKNYNNHEQVRYLYPEYVDVRAKLDAAGLYPYNDRFANKLPSLATTDRRNEDTAIYMLQTMHNRDTDYARRDAFLADGGRYAFDIVKQGETIRGTVVEAFFYVGGTGWRVTPSARLYRDERGTLRIIAKGKRLGSIAEGTVYIKEATR